MPKPSVKNQISDKKDNSLAEPYWFDVLYEDFATVDYIVKSGIKLLLSNVGDDFKLSNVDLNQEILTTSFYEPDKNEENESAKFTVAYSDSEEITKSNANAYEATISSIKPSFDIPPQHQVGDNQNYEVQELKSDFDRLFKKEGKEEKPETPVSDDSRDVFSLEIESFQPEIKSPQASPQVDPQASPQKSTKPSPESSSQTEPQVSTQAEPQVSPQANSQAVPSPVFVGDSATDSWSLKHSFESPVQLEQKVPLSHKEDSSKGIKVSIVEPKNRNVFLENLVLALIALAVLAIQAAVVIWFVLNGIIDIDAISRAFSGQ